MSQTIRKLIEETNELLKEHNVPQLKEGMLKEEPKKFKKCPACEGEWIITASRIPEGNLQDLILNMEHKFICLSCKTVIDIEL
jgi:uncharacterized protein with PIN domain